MTADDLAAALDRFPEPWARALDLPAGWQAEVLAAVRRASGDRPIAPDDPFRALRFVAPDDVKVVVFGQDPYPTAGHADGLAFSAGVGRPRSLARIFDVLAADRPGFRPPATWRLDAWAERGVLLLNPTLTVEVGRAGSHLGCGWQALTTRIVQYLCGREAPPVFLLWGGKAADFFAAARPRDCIAKVLTARHPSYDFKREFMADESHFLATRELVDWWALGDPPA